MVYVNYLTGFKKIPPKSNGKFVKLSTIGEKEFDKFKHNEQDEGK